MSSLRAEAGQENGPMGEVTAVAAAAVVAITAMVETTVIESIVITTITETDIRTSRHHPRLVHRRSRQASQQVAITLLSMPSITEVKTLMPPMADTRIMWLCTTPIINSSSNNSRLVISNRLPAPDKCRGLLVWRILQRLHLHHRAMRLRPHLRLRVPLRNHLRLLRREQVLEVTTL